jgi:myo-inositol-1(or 4)-monophosphatase
MLDIAIQAATKAGKVLETYFQSSFLERTFKDDKSIVTQADTEAEKCIVKIIQSHYPDHAFLAEESGEKITGSEYTWIVDPLDGTSNFANGIPIFAVSIALLKNKEPVCAVVHNPITNALFVAEKGKGAQYNKNPIRVSSQAADKAMISIGTSAKPEDKELVGKFFVNGRKFVKSVRYLGSAALELCYLARGGTEGFINIGTSKWDYAAGILLVLEAGGKITDFQGNPWSFDQNYFIASNGRIHSKLLELAKAVGL